MFTAPEQQSLQPHITAIDPPSRRMFFRVALIIVAIEPLIVLIIMRVVGTPWWVIACVFALGFAILALVFWIIAATIWKPWQRRFPAQPVLAGAVSQSWQSFGFGVMARLNNCITIIADEKHLHLQPFAPLRWFGSKSISLPLDRIEAIRPSAIPALGFAAKIDGRKISGPEWCLSLAAMPETQSP